MSKQVDLTRPITDGEREYLKLRAREDEIIANDRQFGHLKDAEKRKLRQGAEQDDLEEEEYQSQFDQDEDDAFDPELVAQVAPLTVKELKARITKLGDKPQGNREDLQIQLLELLEGGPEEPEGDDEDEDEDSNSESE